MKRILKYGGVWLKRIGGFLLIFVLLLSGLLHSVWFQSAAGRYAGDFCSRWSGLDVQVGQLQFSLFKKAVRVCDFRVSDTKGQPMVEAESVYLAFSNYVFKGVDIAVLSVRRPRIHIIRPSADSVSDFKALLQQLGTLKKNKDKRSVTSIRRLRVEEGLFVYDNRAVPVRASTSNTSKCPFSMRISATCIFSTSISVPVYSRCRHGKNAVWTCGI